MKKLFIKASALLLSAAMILTGCQAPTISNGDTTSTTPAEETTLSETTAAEETVTTPSDSPEPSEDEDEVEDNGFAVRWELAGTWMDGDNFCGGYNAYITNNTGSTVDGWTAEFTVPNGFELSSQWTGIFEVNGDKVTVTNESYNGTIENEQEVSFGFNYISPKEFEPSNITVNGETADSQVAATTTTTPAAAENNTENTTTSSAATTTTAQTTTTTKETVPPAPADPSGTTPVSQHGQLSLKGTQIVDKNGSAYQLKGMSTHGIAWFPDFVNEQAFKTLRDDWNTNVVRLAMYSGESEGYSGSNMAQHEALVKKGIDIAIKLDMYVIVDWHVLADQSPQVRKADALRFFDEISSTYGSYPNIIYEICNEPNGYASWEGEVKPYAEEVIPVIRKNDPDSLIIVGTPTWSQDIDKALANPLKYDNVLYALHFYAATHTDWLRDRVTQCVNKGLPVFVSEFGCCDASGNGANDFNQTKQWLQMLDSLGISYVNWNLANKAESSSAFKPSASANGNWKENDLSESGAWIRKWFRGEQ